MSELEVKDGAMRVRGDLYWDNESEFVLALDTLLESKSQELSIDLSAVKFMFSPFVSHLVRFCLAAKDVGKQPEIIVGDALAEVFRASGLTKELPIRCLPA